MNSDENIYTTFRNHYKMSYLPNTEKLHSVFFQFLGTFNYEGNNLVDKMSSYDKL